MNPTAIIQTQRAALRSAIDALLAAVDDEERDSTDATREQLVTAANDMALSAHALNSAYRVQTEKRSAD